jgi:ketosteroid isomerase-like protein
MSMKYTIGILILMTVAIGNTFGQCSDADKKALEAFDMTWSKAGQAGDKTALMNIYAADYIGFPAMVNKTSAIDATMKTFERNKTNPPTGSTVPDHFMITCSPVSATVVHRNTTTTKNADGTERSSYSRSVHFLEKRGGKWQVVSNAGGGLTDSDMLTYMELDWINAIKNRNSAWLEKNYASDFTEVSFMTGDVATKRQAIDGLMADTTVFDSMTTEDLNVRVDGNSAIVTGIGHMKGKDASGKPMEMSLRFTDTFIKRDGRWQAWASQGMVIPR